MQCNAVTSIKETGLLTYMEHSVYLGNLSMEKQNLRWLFLTRRRWKTKHSNIDIKEKKICLETYVVDNMVDLKVFRLCWLWHAKCKQYKYYNVSNILSCLSLPGKYPGWPKIVNTKLILLFSFTSQKDILDYYIIFINLLNQSDFSYFYTFWANYRWD